MRFSVIIAIIMLLVNALVDLYIYAALRSYLRRRLWATIQAVTAFCLPIGLILLIFIPPAKIGDSSFTVVMWGLFTYVTIYLGKYLFLIFDALSRLPVIFGRKRWRWMPAFGGVLGVAACAWLWWSALTDKDRITVNEIDINVTALPASFEGLRIAQISDLHLGTFGSDTSFVSRQIGRAHV